MSFKEQIEKDLKSVFLNVDEFGELHTIEGKQILVVIDNDVFELLAKIGDNRIHGMSEADMVIMGKVTDFPKDMEPGRLLNVDGREHIVITATRDMGLIEIALRQNRMN